MLGIYLHWPFCTSRCAYCDFVSSTKTEDMPQYAQALNKEIRRNGRLYREQVDSIFIGGGTPSCAPALTLAGILRTVRTSFSLAENPEVTVEANPGSVSREWLEKAREAGVNRLSMGLQSASAELLARLGRQHTPEVFIRSFEDARRAGFENLSVDLIYGIPGQQMKDWEETLQSAVQLSPEHLSMYSLSLEPGTRLAYSVQSGRLPAPDEDLAAEMYTAGIAYLEARGLKRYEISNLALPGRECRHNLKYWRLQDYLGLGAAAHSMIRRLRFANTRSIGDYLYMVGRGKYPLVQCELVTPEDREREFFMLTTRCAAGFSPEEFRSVTGKVFREAGREGLARAQGEGLIELGEGRYIPTDRGFLFQNRLAALLMEGAPG